MYEHEFIFKKLWLQGRKIIQYSKSYTSKQVNLKFTNNLLINKTYNIFQ